MDKRTEVIRAYMAALDAGDYEAIVELFAPEGVVTSPFLGTLPAAEFFERLSQASEQNVITPLDVTIVYDTHPIRAEHGDRFQQLATDD